MRKIEEFRKKEFRNTIKTIAEQGGADFGRKDIKWFLGNDGIPRNVRINKGETVENVIAGYWKNDGSAGLVTLGDYEAFQRDVKIADIIGESVPVVKDFQKKAERQVKEIEVGKIYATRSEGRCSTDTNLVMVTKKTKTKAWFVNVSFEVPGEYMKAKTERTGPEFEVRCPLSELIIEDISLGNLGERTEYVMWSKQWYRLMDFDRDYIESYWFD